MSSAAQVLAAAAEENVNPLIPQVYDLFWSLVVFVIIGLVVWRVGLPRITALLDQRSAAIEGNIQQAQTAQREANEALERYTAQLADARVEAGKIRDQAREDAKRIVAEARDQAQVEADRIVTQGNAQVEPNRAKAASTLRTEVGSLALSLASGVIGANLADDDNAAAYVDRFIADLSVADGASK